MLIPIDLDWSQLWSEWLLFVHGSSRVRLIAGQSAENTRLLFSPKWVPTINTPGRIMKELEDEECWKQMWHGTHGSCGYCTTPSQNQAIQTPAQRGRCSPGFTLLSSYWHIQLLEDGESTDYGLVHFQKKKTHTHEVGKGAESVGGEKWHVWWMASNDSSL